MKWWISWLIDVALFIAIAALSDLWWQDKPYGPELVPRWIIKGLIAGSILAFMLQPSKKKST